MVELLDARDPRVESIWRELELAARPAYFLTWGWMENWLAMLPPEDRPQLAVLRDRGACFLGRRRVVRHHWLPSETVLLNATGVAYQDELCIEHNGVLAASGWTLADVARLVPPGWDELVLPGIPAALVRDVPAGLRLRVDRIAPAPYVELDRVRAAPEYLALLSANTRAQIRRARRRIGAHALEVARSLPEAFAIYDELVALHRARWPGGGAFADPWFDRFHRRLIEQRFAHGEIQLVRLRAGTTTIGCLYNFVAYGRVAFYQSGLAAIDDPAVKPGLVTHAAAIEHCAAEGHAIYDLLAGNARYKASLATARTELAWVRLQQPRLRFAIEDRLRAWKHAFAGASA